MHCTIEMVKNNTGQRNKHDLQCQLNLKSNLSSNTCLSCALRHRRRSSRRLGFSSIITQDVEILSDNIFSLIYHRKKPLRNIKYIGHNLINWINLSISFFFFYKIIIMFYWFQATVHLCISISPCQTFQLNNIIFHSNLNLLSMDIHLIFISLYQKAFSIILIKGQESYSYLQSRWWRR